MSFRLAERQAAAAHAAAAAAAAKIVCLRCRKAGPSGTRSFQKLDLKRLAVCSAAPRPLENTATVLGNEVQGLRVEAPASIATPSPAIVPDISWPGMAGRSSGHSGSPAVRAAACTAISAWPGAASCPGWSHGPARARRTPVPPLGPAAVLQRARPGRIRLGRGSRATPDACLLELRNSGPKFIAAVRRAISELGLDGASGTPAGAGERQDPGPASPPRALPPQLARALQLAARWAVAERGASTFGDFRTLAPGIAELPPDVARSRDRISQLDLQSITGPAPAFRGWPHGCSAR